MAGQTKVRLAVPGSLSLSGSVSCAGSMDDLGDNAAKIGAELIKAGAILPAAGGGRLYSWPG